MGYSAEVVKKVREDFENKRAGAVRLAESHQNEIALKNPTVLEIDKALSMTGLSVFKASMAGSEGLEEKIEKIKKENLTLQSARRQLLADMGYPEDYLDIKYSCEKCNDTGYVGIKMCTCLKKALAKEAYNHSGLGRVLNTQIFRNFDLSYYDGEDKEHMAYVVEMAKKYVSDFGKSDAAVNLLFMGTTGLGKTHITTAIAKGVIDKAYDVVYDSAQNIIRAFEAERFDKDDRAGLEAQRYFDCDLLIIDDLGTELKNNFTQSCLYNLLNSRINAGKAMIISTNLVSKDQFILEYDERISSRLIGNFKPFKFVGTDIRLKKIKNKK